MSVPSVQGDAVLLAGSLRDARFVRADEVTMKQPTEYRLHASSVSLTPILAPGTHSVSWHRCLNLDHHLLLATMTTAVSIHPLRKRTKCTKFYLLKPISSYNKLR